MNNLTRSEKMRGASIMLLLLLGLSGCCVCLQASPPPIAPCSIESLLLNASIFPGNEWEEIGPPNSRSAPSEIGVERIGTSFSTPTNGVANHHVYRLFDDQKAKDEFEHSVTVWFLQGTGESEWLTPAGMDLSQIRADRYQIRCSTFLRNGAEKCRYIAQYGPYLVEFSTDMLIVSYDDLGSLVKSIDKKMTSCMLEN